MTALGCCDDAALDNGDATDTPEDGALPFPAGPIGTILVEPVLGLNLISRKERNDYRTKMNNERTRLGMLIDGVSSVERWLVDQKLVPLLEWCPVHRTPMGDPMRLKIHTSTTEIGWRCEACSDSDLIPLLKGSIFEGVFLPPSTLLLLVWHWAKLSTFTAVQSDTGVTHRYITLVDRCIRALCAMALHRHPIRLGDEGDTVQIGLTTFPVKDKNGVVRSTREILAALEPRRCLLRMRVYDLPVSEKSRVLERLRVQQQLLRWLHPGARVAADAIDSRTLSNMGFQVIKCSMYPDHLVAGVMSYLCVHLPPMYQRNCSHIRLAPMQLFLEELAWRERFGPVPFLAYVNILHHISDLTQEHAKAPEGIFPKTPRFVDWLLEVVRNPFRDCGCQPDGDIHMISENAHSKPKEAESTPQLSLQRKRAMCTGIEKAQKSTSQETSDIPVSKISSSQAECVSKIRRLFTSQEPVRRYEQTCANKCNLSPETSNSKIISSAQPHKCSRYCPLMTSASAQRGRRSQMQLPQKLPYTSRPPVHSINQSGQSPRRTYVHPSVEQRPNAHMIPSSHQAQHIMNQRIQSAPQTRALHKAHYQEYPHVQFGRLQQLQENPQIRTLILPAPLSAPPHLREKPMSSSPARRLGQQLLNRPSGVTSFPPRVNVAPSNNQYVLSRGQCHNHYTKPSVSMQPSSDSVLYQDSLPRPNPYRTSTTSQTILEPLLQRQRMGSPTPENSRLHLTQHLLFHSNVLGDRGSHQQSWNNLGSVMENVTPRPSVSPLLTHHKSIPRRHVTGNPATTAKQPVKRQHGMTQIRQHSPNQQQCQQLSTQELLMQQSLPQQHLLFPGRIINKHLNVCQENGDSKQIDDKSSNNPPKRVRHLTKMVH